MLTPGRARCPSLKAIRVGVLEWVTGLDTISRITMSTPGRVRCPSLKAIRVGVLEMVMWYVLPG